MGGWSNEQEQDSKETKWKWTRGLHFLDQNVCKIINAERNIFFEKWKKDRWKREDKYILSNNTWAKIKDGQRSHACNIYCHMILTHGHSGQT